MSIGRLVPWGRHELPVRRLTNTSSTPASIFDAVSPLREVEQLMEQLVGAVNTQEQLKNFSPALDLHETEKGFEIVLELPGMNEKDIDISVSRDLLTISGEKKSEKEERAKGAYRLERSFGSFSRSITLPRNSVDTNNIEADYTNGLLTVTLPKTPDYQEEARKIKIGLGKSVDVPKQ
ncbi:MAG: Hsp20/alpha crystallin family protein [Candidatus Obscuribacterales bacterium]|nr:Hsp20/alpha crystallin family protein [Candidatus Obscuribacterales bacterium]